MWVLNQIDGWVCQKTEEIYLLENDNDCIENPGQSHNSFIAFKTPILAKFPKCRAHIHLLYLFVFFQNSVLFLALSSSSSICFI